MISVLPPQLAPRFPPRFVFALILMGVTALVAQVALTRELLVLFLGNELSIALVFSAWLITVAAGSALGSKLGPRFGEPLLAFAGAQLLLSLLLPLSLLTVRLVQPGDITPGQVLTPGAMLLTSVEVLCLVCLVAGFQFVLGARAAAARGGAGDAGSQDSASPIALVYALEAFGAVIGGIAFHFCLAEYVTPFRTFGALGLLNTISALSLLRLGPLRASALKQAPAIILAGALLALVALAGRVETTTLRASPRWSNLNPVVSVPSKYGVLVATDDAGQVSVFQSGVLLFTSQDDYSNEVVAHLPLLQHPNPRRVLLIGGAVSGLVGEVLKHPIAELQCVELDPRLVTLAHRWLPPKLLTPLADRRVNLHLGDGRLFVRRARAPYDVIIVNLPDPTTASLNRFYTEEFFREARDALAPDGLLALSLTGSSHHLSGSLRLTAATTYRTLEDVFPEQLLVPGEQMFFLAAREAEVISEDWQVLAARLRERNIRTDFINDAWLQDALVPFRAQLVQQMILEEADVRVNTDLNPVSYYQQTRVWLDQLSPALARALRPLSHMRLWWAAVPLILVVLGLALTRGRGPARVTILAATAAIGAFGILVEVLGLLAFQSACGYLYHALGVLIAAFMAGLAIGAAVISRWETDRRTSVRVMLAGLAAAALLCALLPWLLTGILSAPALAPAALGLLLALAGSMVGLLFPVATTLYRRTQSASAAGGAIYAADLAGSAGGALAAGVFAIPLLGAAGASYAGALLLGAAFLMVLPLLRD